MKLPRTNIALLGFWYVAVAAATAACAAGSGFVSSWQAPDAEPLQIAGSRVAAIAMIDDEASRRVAEDAIARELRQRGADGVPLYTLLPDARPRNEATVRAAMERAQVAGAVVMRPVDTRTEVVVTPELYTGATYVRLWDGYYAFGWADPWIGATRASRVETQTVVTVETLVYSLRQNKLVWGGQSRATNPSSVDRLVEQTATKAARELARRGLIAG